MLRRAHLVLVALVLGGCTSSAGGCLEASPTPLPPSARLPDAVQLWVTPAGLARIETGWDDVGRQLLPNGVRLEVQPSCRGATRVCCGQPAGACMVEVDAFGHPGDAPRLSLRPSDDGALELGLRVRAWTAPGPLPVEIRSILGSGDCEVAFDTRAWGDASLSATARLRLEPDATLGTTRVLVEAVAVDGVDEDDIHVSGGGVCDLAQTFRGVVVDMIAEQLQAQAGTVVDQLLCQACTSDAACGPEATCSAGLCVTGTGDAARCVHQLGMAGRVYADQLVPDVGHAPLDVAIIAGGRGETSARGLEVGLEAGLRPAAGAAPSCGPSAPEPAAPPTSSARLDAPADLGAGFDVAFGVHLALLERAAWAAYQADLFCQTIDTTRLPSLTSDALTLLLPSSVQLLDGVAAPVRVRLRPQAPPTFRAGTRSLLDVRFPALHLDFEMLVDERPVRLFTATLDLTLPVNLDHAAGGLKLAVADLDGVFDGATIDASGVLAESPEVIATHFGPLAGLVMPLVLDSLAPLTPPRVAGLGVDVHELRMVAGGELLAVFGDLETVASPSVVGVDTTVQVVSTTVPPRAAYGAATLLHEARPAVTLAVSGRSASGGALEWQVRVDAGPWSEPSRAPVRRVSTETMWLAGRHHLEVRARLVGDARSVDTTPASVDVELVPAREDGSAAAAVTTGCQAAPAPSTSAAPWLLLVVVLLLWLARRGARLARRGAWLARRGAWLTLLLASGCVGVISGTSPADGEDDVPPPPVYGRFNALLADADRVLVAAYEGRDGDLVLADATEGPLTWRLVDGRTPGAVGDDPGLDVGRWVTGTMLDGHAVLAYQDLDEHALRVAVENDDGGFVTRAVDTAAGADVGSYASMARGPGGGVAIAYVVTRLDGGVLASELRLAESAAPATSAWRVETITQASAPAAAAGVAGVPPATGTFATALHLADGRTAVVFHDHATGTLELAVREGSTWQRQSLDDGGAFARAVVDTAGTLHVAYADPDVAMLRYLTWSHGQVVSRETIDDGEREGGAHAVGAAAALVLDAAGAPVVLYQDGFSVDLLRARRAEGAWARDALLDGSLGYGFATSAHARGDVLWVATFAVDPARYPIGELALLHLP